MIPTREQIEADWANPRFTPETTALIWLRAMRDEIDRLRAERDRLRVERDEAAKISDDRMGEIGKLRADLDRANTEAALARDAMAKATTDTCAKVQNELRSVERALCSADVLIKYAEWPRGAYECHVKNTIETAIDALRDDSATTPYSPPFEGDPKDCAFKASDPVREAAIRAWEEEALFDMYEHADDDEKAHQDDAFLVRRREITAAVAMMRSAGDPDAKLRELRAWILEMWWVASQGKWETGAHTAGKVVGRIDEMLARPAPSHVYSRGRTIAESAEPPTAYYPPSPVEQPAAAVPDHFPDAGKIDAVLHWLEDGK